MPTIREGNLYAVLVMVSVVMVPPLFLRSPLCQFDRVSRFAFSTMLKRNIYKSSFCACANLLLESTLVLVLATARDSFAFPVCWEAIGLGIVRKHRGTSTHI